MVRKKQTHVLNVEVRWNGHPMQNILLVPGDRCRPYVIGDRRDASFPIDASAMGGREVWTLVEPDGTVCVPPLAGASRGGARVKLEPGTGVLVRLEPFVFEIKAVSSPPSLRLPVEFNWSAFAWSSTGILLFGLSVAALLLFRPEMPHHVRERFDGLEQMFLSLAGDADKVLARIDGPWSVGPDLPVDGEDALPCEPAPVIEIGSSSPVVSGSGPGYGRGSNRQLGLGNGMSWSSGGTAGGGQEAGSLLGYGMCMLPGADEAPL